MENAAKEHKESAFIVVQPGSPSKYATVNI
jgi:hypothetical protein